MIISWLYIGSMILIEILKFIVHVDWRLNFISVQMLIQGDFTSCINGAWYMIIRDLSFDDFVAWSVDYYTDNDEEYAENYED